MTGNLIEVQNLTKLLWPNDGREEHFVFGGSRSVGSPMCEHVEIGAG